MRDAIRSAQSRGRFPLFVLLGLQLLCGHRLASADELGHVQIKAPVGVEVQLDGKPLGTTGLDASGLLVPNVAPGEHTLLFTKPGFNAKEVRVVVVAGEVTEYTLDLSAAAPRVTQEGGGDSTRLAAASGSIQVSSLPIEAVISIPAAHIASNRKTQKTWTLQNAPAGPIEVIATALSKRLSCKFTLPPGGTAPVFFNFATMQAVGPVERAVAAATPKAEVGDWSAVDFELALGEPFGARAEDLADKHREPYRTWLAANGRSAAARAIGEYRIDFVEMGVTAAHFRSNDDHGLGKGLPELYLIVRHNGKNIMQTGLRQDSLICRASDVGSPSVVLAYKPGDTFSLELWEADPFNDDQLGTVEMKTSLELPIFPLGGRHQSKDGGMWIELRATKSE